ncbi:hypothetical protein [Salinibacter grassmerensis]|uniref:hypothetical protein n=1 Tax=Salinibacter grassmerensis TaxID=3040353 RepID=UPI0021E71CAD|nr:hypothetical protein [Salinibacter grassmerensis]
MARLPGPIQTLRGLWPGLGTALLVLLIGGSVPLQGALGQPTDVQALLEQGAAAGVNVEQMRTVAERARQAGLSEGAAAALLEPAVALAKQDLPTDPLLSKTLEGLAKQVPSSRMQPVLQQYRTRTEQAGQFVTQWARRDEVRQLLGTEDAPSEANPQTNDRASLVAAVAEARQQGVAAGHVESFLSGLPNGVERRPVSMTEVAAAVNVLPDLPGNGASPETTTQLVTAALDAGYSPESLRQLPSALRSARQNSNRPVDALAQGTAQAITRGTPAASVLQSLFQGAFPGGGPPSGVGNGPPGNGPPGNGPGTGKPPETGPPDDPPGGNGPPGNSGGGP